MNKLLLFLTKCHSAVPLIPLALNMKSYYLEIGHHVTRQIPKETTTGHARSLAFISRLRKTGCGR